MQMGQFDLRELPRSFYEDPYPTYRLLRESDLAQVRAEAYFPIAAPACTILEAASVRQVRSQLVAAGLATGEEIETHLENLARGDLDLMLAPMITAWGRKPA